MTGNPPPDYVAAIFSAPEDAEHYGVKGMKWGVRRSSAQLRSAATKRTESTSKKEAPESKPASSSSKGSSSESPSSTESSSDRYARLAAAAKKDGSNSLTDTDLKFFNARTEAIKKVDALYKKQENPMKDITKKVLLNSTERTMQTITDELGKKYISGPLIESMQKSKVAEKLTEPVAKS